MSRVVRSYSKRPYLVDPKLLKCSTTKKLKIIQNSEKIEFPSFSVAQVLGILFGLFIVLYLWDFVRNNDPDPNPELSFLPDSIRNNEFFSKLKSQTPQTQEQIPTPYDPTALY